MGMHNTGIHSLVEYVSTYFNVVVYSPMQCKNDCLLAFNHWSLWKHTVPLQPLSLPSAAPSGRVTLLVTVRDVMSWLVSMAKKPYAVYPPGRNHKRKRGDLRWLLREITLEAD